ncbi:PHD FINGER PROTEINS [Salix purpurea]|uniref:Enhancer of polycomb-like protein n=1 Tax=Salix purpurea TaxID=77065 RepID=A0A9Q0UMB4_SALPP|nr:PHD FINGER PROTEINS [Salix purpurea]
MENRAGKSHGVEIPKKSRSLDLKSLYESKNPKGDQNSNNLKRKGGGGAGDDDKGHEKKKSRRKEVSISSFKDKNANSSYSKSLKEVYNRSLSPGLKESKSGLIQRLADSNGFSGVSLPLDGGAVKIPRRKRGFVGRRKVDNGSEGSKLTRGFGREAGNADQADKLAGEDEGKWVENGSRELNAVGISGGEVDDVNQASKLTVEDKGKQVEPLKAKQKKGSDDSKENRNGELNASRNLEEEDGHDGHFIATKRDSLSKKPHNGPSVDNNGDLSLKKSLRKGSRKKKDMVADKKRTTEDDPSVDTSMKMSGVLHDEDENLEENAAMMLSSRFNPSCTGFSSNSKASASPSKNDFREFDAHGSSYLSGSESSSVDTDGRVLRPRKHKKEKGGTRKRRHYYEVFSRDVDAHWVLNRRIKVFWPLDQNWYHGLVGDYDKERKLHHIKYDDRDEEWINLQNERFKLLLLPSEVPGKTRRKRSVTSNKCSDGLKEKLTPRKEKKDLMTEDDSYEGAYMESEPIISWLARSTNRVKSSPLNAMKKQKTSFLSSTLTPLSSLNRDKCKLSINSASSDSVATDGRSALPVMESPVYPKDSKLPIVYYRKRFRKTGNVSRHESKGICVSASLPETDSSLVPLTVAFWALQEHYTSHGRLDRGLDSNRLDSFDPLWSTGNAVLLRLNISATKLRWFRFKLSLQLPSVSNYYSFGSENVWLIHAVQLLQYGMLMTTWPRIHLEMLFVDNMVGLRFLQFEGCLMQAVAFVFLVLTVFHQPGEQGKCADFQLPITSIRYKFSCIRDLRKHFAFSFYNFSEVENSKWKYLDHKLKRHCLVYRQLSLSECTYDNIKALQCGKNQLFSPLVCSDATLNKVLHRRSRQSVSLMGLTRESTCVNGIQSSFKSDKNHRYLPSFALSFTAAPTYFFGLHLKMLVEHSVMHINSRDHNSIEHPEKPSGLVADSCASIEDCSKACLDCTPGNDSKALTRGADYDGCISCAKPESQTVDVSICSAGDWKETLSNQSGDVNVEISASFRDLGESGSGAIVPLQNLECKHSESKPCDLLSRLPVNKDETDAGSHALSNGITVDIPSFNQFDQHVNKESQGVQQSSDLSWNMNGGAIPSPNRTARRSTWHRNRSSFSSFGWSDERADFLQNNFGNGPKKPRTQVSYALPFGGFDYSPRNKGHQQKGVPHKRIRTATEKRTSYISRGSERNLELLSCDANVLITNGDKGWRECGVQVVLELFDHNEWRLGVKLSGTTKYSYKAHQFLQTGSTNRFTHAMMWKGGKDWSLEFPDRSQWALFKEIHEECYNRNIRAASVKNIPIPGVRLIEENDDNGIEVPFFRGCKYFQQLESDVEMALDPSRVLYDMDSDDEQWMLKNRSSTEVNGNSWQIPEEMFEKAMDKFEKAAYSQQRDQFTFNEMVEFMTGIEPTEAIKTIHEYWQHKRQRKRMPLIRHLQPPLWERYQQQLREWEQAMTRSNTGISNGCHEKFAPADKPPMCAFCLKPRGLEVPNKGSKQRSHKKFSVTGQSIGLAGNHDGLHPYGRRTNGFASRDEKTIYSVHNNESFDDSSLPQISPRVFSPREACGHGYVSLNGDGYDRNSCQKLCRTKSKKLGTFVSPYDVQMASSYNHRMLDQRNGSRHWNLGFSDWPSQRHHQTYGYVRHGREQWNDSDLDEFRFCDASGAAKHALNMAKLKRDRAQRLLYRADLAIHKAVVALMNAEAIKAASEDINGDG